MDNKYVHRFCFVVHVQDLVPRFFKKTLFLAVLILIVNNEMVFASSYCQVKNKDNISIGDSVRKDDCKQAEKKGVETSVVKVNDINIYYEKHGQGEPLVLVSGYAADHTSWERVVPELAKKYSVIIFDNRGSGRSDAPDNLYTLDQMADDLAALVDYLNIKRASVLGHSMGGLIALKFASKYPQKLNSLILVGTRCKPPGFPLPQIESLHKELFSSGVCVDLIIKNFFLRLYAKDFFYNKALLDAEFGRIKKQASFVKREGLAGQLHARKEDLTVAAKKIKAKTMIIYGDEDVLNLPKRSQYLQKTISGSIAKVIEQCGHMPQIEKPAIFIRYIKEFLN